MITSASCSIAPDSRRSASCGFLLGARLDRRLSCESAITGTLSSLASALSEREMLGDLLLAAVGVDGAAHELQVVDDDQAELGLALALQPPRLGAQLEDADSAGVSSM